MNIDVAGVDTFVHAPDGIDADRPPIVFLHGAGLDHSLWRFQTRWASSVGFCALAPDLPGHGRSDGKPLAGIEEMSAWVAALCDRLELAHPVVVGHSMGSLIALDLAAIRPSLAGSVLVSSSDRMVVHPELAAAAEDGDRRAVELIVGWSISGSHRLGGHPGPGTWSRAMLERLLERGLRRNLAVDLQACGRYDATETASRVRVPVLVIVGERDLMTPASAGRRLAEHLSAPVVEIAGGSHMALFEESQKINPAILDWIRRFAPVETH